jgi:hypothetical protein
MRNYQQQKEAQVRSEALARANNFKSFQYGGCPLLGLLILVIGLPLLMEGNMTPENFQELDKTLLGIATFIVALLVFLDLNDAKNFVGYTGNKLLAVLGGLFAGQAFVWFAKALYFVGFWVVAAMFFSLLSWLTWLAMVAAFIGLMFGGLVLNGYLRKAFEACTGYSSKL